MSQAAKKLEWLVVIFDNAVNQRLKLRPDHLKRIPQLIADKKVTSLGPIFKDDARKEFAGSCFTLPAESRSEVIEFLKQDIYAQNDVWNFDNVLIYPYSAGFREDQSGNSGDTGNGTDSDLTSTSVEGRDSWGRGGWSRGDVGGWDGAWAGDGHGGRSGDGDGLVVDNEVGWLWAVGGEASDDNVSGNGDVSGNGSRSESSWDNNRGELHY